MKRGQELLMLPDFICIGAYKSGTTWLNTVLLQHPEVFVPREKELMFFSRYYHRGIGWYQDFFSDCGEGDIIGEICPAYLSHPDAPGRIHKHIPDARLLVCLRNPADQVYSMYNMGVRRGRYDKPFESLVFDENFSPLRQAFYARHIKRFLTCFDKSQILFLLYDDLQHDAKWFLKNIYDFMGIAEFYPEDLTSRVNRGGVPRYVFLDRLVAKAGMLLRRYNLYNLKGFLNRAGISNHLKKLNLRKTGVRPMDNKTREYLNRLYYKDRKELEDMLERDLSFWQ